MSFYGSLHPYQKDDVELMKDAMRVLVAYEMGLGKLAPLTEPVLTPTGWRTMGELRCGDFVIGGDGFPTEVLGVYPQGLQEIVRVTLQDGAWTRCGWEHLWAVNTPTRRFTQQPHRVLSTRALVDEGLISANGNRRHFLPDLGAVQYAQSGDALPLDPYALGVVLGNGSLCSTKTIITGDTEVADSLGWRGKHREHPSEGITDFRVEEPDVERALTGLGLRGKRSWQKHVPVEYLHASAEQRLALLQGLMDTDGYAMPNGGAEFSSSSAALMDAVVDLVRSLGGVARGRRAAASTYTYQGKQRQGRPAERVNIKLPSPLIPFRGRKVSGYVVPTKYPPARSIVSVEPDGREAAVCIRVANPDGLYVTRDFIVTHNTVMTIAAIEDLHDDGQLDSGLVIAPSGLRYQWAEKIDQFTQGEARWLVIDGPPDKRAEQYRAAATGAYRYVLVSYDQVVNDWKQVRRLPRDFLVGDEITAIKGFRSQRSKRVKRLTAPYVYGLTGDPMDGGRCEELFSIMQWIDEDVLGRFDLFDRTFIVRNSFGGIKRYRNVKTFREVMAGHWCRRTQDEPDVAPYLPRVQPPRTLHVTLDPASRRLYQRIAQELQADLAEAAAAGMGGGFDLAANYGFGGDSADSVAMRGKIMSKTQALLALCDHPELLRHSAKRYVETAQSGGGGGSAYAYELQQAGLLDKLKATPKADVAVELLEQVLVSPRSKVVLFSHDVPTLGYLQSRTLGSLQYHGGMNAKEKDAAVQAFQKDPAVRVLLASDAGGYGLDLPAGNVVINFDQPWTNGASKQRNSRIIRASSTWPTVHHYNLLVQGSLDEWQHQKVSGKHAVSAAFVDGRGLDKKGGLALDLAGLAQFLRENEP